MNCSLARYYAKRWFSAPDEADVRFVHEFLEALFGRNGLYFIEETRRGLARSKRTRGEVIRAGALDGFCPTGDPEEDHIIAHAGLVWTHMNGAPWPAEVYRGWVQRLVKSGSEEAAYLAASLWPARGLMDEVSYRPVKCLIYEGTWDERAERRALAEMLKRLDPLFGVVRDPPDPCTVFVYDSLVSPEQLPSDYIKQRGFDRPICGLVNLDDIEKDEEVAQRVRAALTAPYWSEGVCEAAMFLYMSIKFKGKIERKTNYFLEKISEIIEKSFYNFSDKQIELINFYLGSSENIDIEFLRKYINYLLVIDKQHAIKTPEYKNEYALNYFKRYLIKGIEIKDIIFVGCYIADIIYNLKNSGDDFIIKWLNKNIDLKTCIDMLSYDSYEYIRNNIIEVKKLKDGIGCIKTIIKNCYNLRIEYLTEYILKEFKILNAENLNSKNFLKDSMELLDLLKTKSKYVYEIYKFELLIYAGIQKKWSINYFYYTNNKFIYNICKKIFKELKAKFEPNPSVEAGKVIEAMINQIYFYNFPNRFAKEKTIENLFIYLIKSNYYLEINPREIEILRNIFIRNREFIKDNNLDQKICEILHIKYWSSAYLI